MTKATLTRIETNTVKGEHPLRTTKIDGTYLFQPEVGRGFRFFSESLTPGGLWREITTSIVQSVEDKGSGVKLLKTLNSTYELIDSAPQA